MVTRVLVACGSFKGSLSAQDVCSHVAAGLRAARPGVAIATLPVADGGDGTVDAAVSAGMTRLTVTVHGPTGHLVDAAIALDAGGRVVVELAGTCGLVLLPDGQLAPLESSSFGLGEAMVAALDAGARDVVVGLGGSASTDGGAGMLQALGARLLDGDGRPIGWGAAGLGDLASVDLTAVWARWGGVQVTLAADVDNPLLGPRGAAAVFGPQKGVDEGLRPCVENGLARLAQLVSAATGRDDTGRPGAGAAGGVGWALLAALNARVRPGIELLLDLVGFAERVRDADLVITGEGSLDEQSLAGKTPVGVARAARAAGVPVVAVCGRLLLDDATLRASGIDAAYALTDLEPDVAVCITRAGPLLERLAGKVARARG